MTEEFDVIILGGGIAGLSIASQLAKTLRVVVFEKDSAKTINKYWLTNDISVKKNQELTHLIDSHYTQMEILAYDLTSHQCKGDYYLWDSVKLIQYFTNEILAHKGNIFYNKTFYSYKKTDDGIVAFVDDKQYNTKLIIDCMGFNSPITLSKSIIDVYGYYILYGATLNLNKPINPIAFANLTLNHQVKYVEIFPTSHSTAHVLVLTPEKSIRESSILKDDFTFLIQKSSLSEYFTKTPINNILSGVIPIGKLKHQALDNIYFFGESGQLNPAATATGFTRILYHYKELSKRLTEHVNSNKLKKNDLNKIGIEFMTPFHRSFQLNIFKDMLEWNSDDFLKFTKQMSSLDNKLVNDILFGDFHYTEIFTYKKIRKLIQTNNWILLKNSLKALF